MHHGGGGGGEGVYARERNQIEPAQAPRNRLEDNERPSRNADDDQRATIDRDIFSSGLHRQLLEPAGLVRAASGATTASVAAAASASASVDQHINYQSQEEQKQQGMATSTAHAPWETNSIESMPFDCYASASTKATNSMGIPLNIESNLPSIDLPSSSTDRKRTRIIPDGQPNMPSSRPSISTDTFSWQNKDAADISVQLDQHIAAMRTATAEAAIQSQGRTICNQFSHPDIGGSIHSSSLSTSAAMPLSSLDTTTAYPNNLRSEEDGHDSQDRDQQFVSSSIVMAASAAAANTSTRKSRNIQDTESPINDRSAFASTLSSYAISQEPGNQRGCLSNDEDPNDLLDQLGITESFYGVASNQVIQGEDIIGEMTDKPPATPQSKGKANKKTKTKTKKKASDESKIAPVMEILASPLPLAMPTDSQWLTPLHCFVREKIVEVFTATQKDVDAPSRGKRRKILLNQVGIRCPHCSPHKAGKYGAYRQGSVYYPHQISAIYNATMNLLQRHFGYCDMVPKEIQDTYKKLKSDEARSGMSKKYWVESAKAFGLVDRKNAIWYTKPTKRHQGTPSASPTNSPIIDQSDLHHALATPSTRSVEGEAGTEQVEAQDYAQPQALVYPEDKGETTRFTFCLLSQILSCRFTEADRLGKRKGLPIGFAGLACRHCYPRFGNGRYFPSSLKTLSDTSKTLNVLNAHLLRCRSCPEDIREELKQTHESHASERSNLPFGSQKALFTRIWERLHGETSVTQPLTNEKESTSPDRHSKEEEGDPSSDSSLKKATSSSSLKKRRRSESDPSSNGADHVGDATRNMPRSDDPEPRIKRSRAA